MKKTTRILLALSLVFVLSLAFVGSASAGKGGNPTGTISAIDETTQSMTLETGSGPITVYLPEGFDYSTIAVDMYVVVRGDWDGDTTIYAATVKETTPEDEADTPDSGGDTGGDTGSGDTSGTDNGNHMNVFCTGKKEDAHPMVTGLAETYGVDVATVSEMYCSGYSIGEIMLALQSEQLGAGSAADLLAARHGGKGWGQIWKDSGLIGNADKGTPPGQQDKPANPGHGGTPPGQEKKNNP